ncbi:MAG: DUF2071 domain-containing protein [Parachlamydia sp.]|jgi:hypothetical protein|nr:DUF2071 domain-containing protein [Parachlamydia sp.]
MPIPTDAKRDEVRNYPDQNPVMDQKWRRMLFLDWEFDHETIQKTLPPGLTVDTFEGKAYLSIVAFNMEGVKPKLFPSIPGLSNFTEINVRTYVYDAKGVPGVWFYSLDANQYIAVQMARQFFSLPYRYSKIASTTTSNGKVNMACQVEGSHAISEFTYQGTGNFFMSVPGTLDFFLTERYVLFANQINQIRTGRVHHKPYPLSQVNVEKWDSLLLESDGFESPHRPPERMRYSSGVDVEVFPLTNS